MNFHGHIRATEDVDVIWVRSPDSERQLLAALTELNAQSIGNEIDPATHLEKLIPISERFVQVTHLMVLVTDRGFLDLFDFIPGFPDADVQAVFAHGRESKGFRYVSLDWLRKMKEVSARPQDMIDLENLPTE
ncbi:MAG TPA: hypothetical protein VIL86_04625 [Tepidisphaeraceae bacterium]